MLIKFKNNDKYMPLTETEAFRGMFDDLERSGVVESPTPTGYRSYMANGFICRVEEFNGKWTPLAYKKIGNRELQIDNLPEFDTRDEAFKALHKIIGTG